MKKLYGVVVPLVTPFDRTGRVDTGVLRAHVDDLIGAGVHCLYPCGTTGEMFKLTTDERKRIDRTVIEAAAGRAVVFAQVGAISTAETIELALHARDAGADGIGVVTPAFFGLSERALEEHFCAVAAAVPELPVYLYAIPQCAVNDITPALAARVAERSPNVVGIKYSYPNMPRILEMLEIRDHRFSVLCGQDTLLYSLLTAGGDGTVSGAANLLPEMYVAVYEAFRRGDLPLALRLQRKANRLGAIVNGANNIGKYKAALPRLRGIDAGPLRAPGENLSPEETDRLVARLEALDWKHPMAGLDAEP